MTTTDASAARPVPADAAAVRPRRRWAVEPFDRRLLALIVLVGLALRVAWAVYAARPPADLHDPKFYEIYAESLARGNGYRLPNGQPTAYYPVGYPAALAVVYFLGLRTPLPDDPVALGVALNVVLAAISLVLVFEIARRLFDRRVGLVAAAVVACYPNLVFHSAVLLTETLFITLALAAVLVVVATDWTHRRTGTLVAIGLLVGASALVRPPSLLFVAALAVAGRWGAGWGWRRSAASSAVVGVAALAVIAPWTYRNTVVMGEPVVISTNTGDNLCIGNNPDADGGFQMPPSCLDGFDHLDRPEYELARDAHGQSEALRWIAENPLEQLRLVPLRLVKTFRGDADAIDAAESYGADPFIPGRLRGALIDTANVAYVVVLVLGLAAVPRLLRGRDPSRLFLLVGALSLVVPPLLFFGDPRFKVPLMPLVAIAAAATVVGLADRVRRRPPPAATPSP